LITEGTEQSIIYPQSSNLVLDLYCTNHENLITICSAIEPYHNPLIAGSLTEDRNGV